MSILYTSIKRLDLKDAKPTTLLLLLVMLLLLRSLTTKTICYIINLINPHTHTTINRWTTDIQLEQHSRIPAQYNRH